MQRLYLFCIALLACIAASNVALAQGPTPAACGLPKQGTINGQVTYTLTANCTQTGTLDMATAANAYTVTIQGEGFQIDASALTRQNALIETAPAVTLVIANATLIGGGEGGKGALHLGYSATLTNVTLRNTYRTAVVGTSGSSGSYTLTNILVENGSGRYNEYRDAASAVVSRAGASFTIENMVVRDMVLGNAAVGIEPWNSNSSLTVKGCFTAERIYPQVFYGNVTDNSTGPCTGTIGNGGQAVKVVPEPTPAACGLPARGILEKPFTDKSSGKRKYVFNLRGNCQQTGALLISQSANVTINGNGRTIRPKANVQPFFTAGTTTIRNAILSGSSDRYFILRAHLREPLLIQNTVFRGNKGPVYVFDGRATLDNVLFEYNSTSYGANNAWAGSAIMQWGLGETTIRDSQFINNSGGAAAIFGGQANKGKTTLEGCVTFSANSPKDINDPYSVLTDNSTGECALYALPAIVQWPPQPDQPANIYPPEVPGGPCVHPIGAIACVYRLLPGYPTRLQVYGINSQSQGFHQLTVFQRDVDAVAEGTVALSADCRARVQVARNRDVTVSVGPNAEGKLLHVVYEGGLHGGLIDNFSTLGETLCGGNGDSGSLALQNCMARTNYMLNLRETPGGEILQLLPYDVTLTAFQRTAEWIKVDYHGLRGWLSIPHVTLLGNCG